MNLTVVETLFIPLRQDSFEWRGKNILFLNAESCPDLSAAKFYLQQYFSSSLEHQKPELPKEGSFQIILMQFPKNIVEGKFQIAQGLKYLDQDGIFVCAADNKAGGARLENIFSEFGFEHVQSIFKNKARVVWGVKGKADIAGALEAGAEQTILDGAFVSQPGIFGWDKIDRGSALLVAHLSDTLQGQGADFGCGYGYLSREILTRSKSITNLMCMDADYRAVSVCRKNLEAFKDRTNFLWCNLTKPQALKNLDFIVMNPPFHEGKKTDIGVGLEFIKNAARSLKSGGVLWMVANTHLPYEPVLKQSFARVEIITQAQGYKVFRAVL